MIATVVSWISRINYGNVAFYQCAQAQYAHQFECSFSSFLQLLHGNRIIDVENYKTNKISTSQLKQSC